MKIDADSEYSRLPVRVALVSLVAVLASCAIQNNPVVRTMQHVVPLHGAAVKSRFNPDFDYLRVVVDGRVVFLAMGNEDKDAHGSMEVWYSAAREVVRFRDGRLVGAVGLDTEWRNVTIPNIPAWSVLARANKPYRWVRTRDVMPGYRYGVKDELVLNTIPAPEKSELLDVDPGKLVWFEEDDVSKVLPPARYGVDLSGGREIVVYGEQCVAPDLCFSWQRWPLAGGKKGN